VSAPNETQAGGVASDPVEFLIRRVSRIRDEEGSVPMAMVELLAKAGNVDLRTAYRWTARGTRQRETRALTPLSDELRTLYFELNGSIARVLRHCAANGIDCPPRETLRRRINRELTAAERAYAKGGEHARRAKTVYLQKEQTHRNAVWEADHKELGVLVMPPRGNAKPAAPWITSFMETKHRVIAGVAITMQPTAGDVVAAFRSGVLNDPGSISPIYGVPDEVHWDNGLEFLAHPITEVAVTMGALPRALAAYSPHLKGRVERWHRTLDEEFLATLPFWQGGPRAANNRLYGPKDCYLSYKLFCARLLEWIEYYNFKRPHSALGGLTPAQSWQADPATVREISADELRWMALPSKQCKVGQSGIHHAGHKYVSPEVIALRDELVEIRYMPHDERSVDVYKDGAFVCTAKVAGEMSAEDQQRFLAERGRQHRAAVTARRAASRRARVRYASITGSGDSAEQVTVFDRDQAEAAGGVGRDREEAPKALAAAPQGLNQPWAPPPATSPEAREEEAS